VQRFQRFISSETAVTVTEKNKAIPFLRRVLAAGARPVREIEQLARESGLLSATAEISQSKSFRSARKKLGVIVRKNGMRGGWSWSLPAQEATCDEKAVAPKMPSGPEDAVDESGAFESAEPPSTQLEHPYGPALAALRAKCPEQVEVRRWQQAIRDAEKFLPILGPSAHRLGWTEGALFGLEPMRLSAVFRGRLAHPDCTGLFWHIRGRELMGISRMQATIRDGNGATSAVYCNNEIRPLR
jgi:hypothetical protein